jgi:hypothetical protein
LVVSNVVKRLSKAVCGHVLGTNMLKLYIAITDLVLDVVIVDVDVLCTLVVTLSMYKVNGWLILTVQLNWAGVFACKRLDLCWPQWVHFGSQEHHRILWNPMESHGTPWNPMKPHGIPQNLMESHGITQNLMEGSETWRNLLVADR